MKPKDENRKKKFEVIALAVAAVTAIIFTMIILSVLRKSSSTIQQSPTLPTMYNAPASSPATTHNDDNEDKDKDDDDKDDDDKDDDD
ncbi:hypothetical protein [Iningainema tapete]|uniref:Uncharacterized protein n=1 Tax=Iningainema tapete BLCC-T55 TaxID=2748662 RepID=A0A8J7C4Q1_9CYAN|nr:hypothetical protein [Iningainema tapete]MBD2771869.1 hypothetical protein [Iningainema tapete BLCC-T55]